MYDESDIAANLKGTWLFISLESRCRRRSLHRNTVNITGRSTYHKSKRHCKHRGNVKMTVLSPRTNTFINDLPLLGDPLAVPIQIRVVPLPVSQTGQVVSPDFQSAEVVVPLLPPQRRTRSAQVSRNNHPIPHARAYDASPFGGKPEGVISRCKGR